MTIPHARWWLVSLVLAAACRDDAASILDASRDGASDDATRDAPVDASGPLHTGGWRTPAHDPTRAGRIPGAGPVSTATLSVFYETPLNNARLENPVIDEDGNLYMVEYRPGGGYELLSLSPAGSVRWHVPIPATFLDQLSLGPDGHLYSFDTVAGFGTEPRIVVYDTNNGSILDYSAPLVGHRNFDVNLTVSADGKILLRSDTATDGYRLRTFRSIDLPSWTVTTGGNGASGFGGYARSPDGATIIVPVSSGTGPPFTVRALDAENGTERWHYDLPTALLSPVLAFGADGSVFIAASQMTSDLHVIKLSTTGQLVWDHTEATMRRPFRLLVGAQSIVVGAEPQGAFAGGLILSAAGAPQSDTFFAVNCKPAVIDANDIAYWACTGNVSATNPAGTKLHDWRRTTNEEVGFELVAGPNATLYTIFSPQNFKPQIYRVR